MKITNAYIKLLKPCKRGIINFDKHYPEYEGTLSELLTLDNIPYSDKKWLVCEVVDYKILQQWSVECAEQVVDNYKELYQGDSRISECIKITKLFLLGVVSLESLSAAASAASAAWSAEDQEDINLSILIDLLGGE